MTHAFEMSDKVPGGAPPPLPALPKPVVQAQRTATASKRGSGEVTAASKRTGRAATLLTGPLGIEEEAGIKKKTLLGA